MPLSWCRNISGDLIESITGHFFEARQTDELSMSVFLGFESDRVSQGKAEVIEGLEMKAKAGSPDNPHSI